MNISKISTAPLRWLLPCILIVGLAVWGYTTSHAGPTEGAAANSNAPAAGVSFTGRIFHRNGTPAANATVEMYGTDNATTTTDASGHYHFTAPTDPCAVKYHCVSFKASITDPSCPGHVRLDNGEGWSVFCWCGEGEAGGENTVGDLMLGSCSNSGGSPAPTPPPSDDKNVKPFPYPSPVPTDSRFYGTAPNDAFTHTVPRSGGPIMRNVDINRVVGEIKPEDGTLKYASELVNNHVVSKYATLKIPAYDVDSNSGELDHVLFNGVEIGPESTKAYLTGQDKAWFISEFRIPIELVRFGTKRSAGQSPVEGHNEVKILVDESNGAPARWRVSVGAPKIEFDAMYPVVMVHGNGSCGGYFAGDWLCQGHPVAPERWFIRPFIDQRIPFDNSIALPAAPIADNAAKLLSGERSILTIAQEWGARHVHIIAHSKGGLDVRGFLTGIASQDEPGDLGILSFTTLSSPHLGSVGADYQDTVAQLNRMRQLNPGNIASSDSSFRVLIAAALGSDAGKHDLRVDTMRQFNQWNIPALPSMFKVDGQSNLIKYFAVAPDANLDDSVADGSVTEKYHPERFLPTITDGGFNLSPWETEGMPHIPLRGVEGLMYTEVYRMFGTVNEAQIGRELEYGVLFPRPIPVVSEIPQPCWFLYNDFAVTRASAVSEVNPCDHQDLPAPKPLVPFEEQAPIKANHATMSSSETALIVINWIRSTQPMPE